MEIDMVEIEKPEHINIILGQAHFIQTVEDIYEALVKSVPGIRFGLAFNESSGPRLTRYAGNDEELISIAIKNIQKIGAGHTFIVVLGNAYPINVLNAIKGVPEVVNIFCATANPVSVVVAKTERGNGILGVIDGGSPLGVEKEEDIKKRTEFLRKIGYKLGG